MIETVLRKRAAQHAGEVGLFPSSEFASEDFALVTLGNDVDVKISSPVNIALQKYMWQLATVVARNVDGVCDKDEALELLCVKARHMRHKLDPRTGKLEISRKSTRIGNEALTRLINRFVYIVVTDLIPGLEEGALRSELEAMVGTADAKTMKHQSGGGE